MTDLAVSSVFAAVMLVALLIPALRTGKLRRSIDRLAERSGLAVSEEVLPSLLRWRRSTWIGYAIGVPVGFELASLAFAGTSDQADGIISFVPTASWLLGGGLGALIGGLVGSRARRPSGRRIARDRRVSLVDYVDPLERRVVVVLGGVALLMGLPSVVRDRQDGIAAGLIGALAVAGAFALAQRTVAAPQRVGSAAALAWEDALRASTARSLIQAGGIAALSSLIVSLPAALAGAGPGRSDLRLHTMLVITVLLVVGAIWSMRRRPARYFLRRLWPETASQLAANERAGMEVQR